MTTLEELYNINPHLQREAQKVAEANGFCCPEENHSIERHLEAIYDTGDYNLIGKEYFLSSLLDIFNEVKDDNILEEEQKSYQYDEGDGQIPGGSTPEQYALPKQAEELQDLIEYRRMNFALGNIFKACYRQGHCSHSDEVRDMHKIIWFAKRELERLNSPI